MKESDRKKGFDDERVLKALNSVTRLDERQFYADFMLGAKMLPFIEILKNSSINVSLKPREVFELGFATESGRLERGVKIKQILPASMALKAGLKEGDEIKGMNFVYGKPQQEAQITVIRENQTIPIRYYPKKTIEMLQVDENAVLPK